MNILVTDTFHTPAFDELLRRGHSVQYTNKPQPTRAELRWAQGLFIRSRTRVSKTLLQQATDLKFIVTATSGQEHIDLQACYEHDVQVVSLPVANAQSAAELTLMLMLQSLRRWSEVQGALNAGRWKHQLAPGHELYQKTVGLVGLGEVGSRVAKLLKSFRTRVWAYDPYKPQAWFYKFNTIRVQSLYQLLGKVGIVSLHVPLTRHTQHMVGEVELERLGPNGVLINTSRGPVLDKKALIRHLKKNPNMTCGLDVFDVEPVPKASPLRRLRQVVLSPHIGAHTHEALQTASQQATQYVLNFVKE